ncbi:hypothetical protein [Aeromonas taiwanensis]|uniref:hypothetical protein n=1 Tax=Aeromonas taiwanensis TaxID=633417 RepID=UPI00248E7F6D|nr:hypothetical protein [Aeromonas taiwanensis]
MSKQGSDDNRQPLEGERKAAYRKLRRRLQGALGVLQGSADNVGNASLALCHPFVPGRQYRVERLAQEQLLLVLTSLIKAVPRAVMDEIMADSEHVLCDTRFAATYGEEEECKEMRARARANLARLNGLR